MFLEMMRLLAGMQNIIWLFNACFPRGQAFTAFERLLNRLERTLKSWDSYGLLVCDEGKESQYTRLVRRMRAYNPVPSRYGWWPDVKARTKNIPLERIIEDPFFKRSEQSFFIQAVDFVAYALLQKERPTPHAKRYKIDKAFDLLDPVLFKYATQYDGQGILRP